MDGRGYVDSILNEKVAVDGLRERVTAHGGEA
jgi:hypothetical protein